MVNGDKQSSGRDPDSSYEYSHKVPQVVEEAPPEEPALVCLDQVDMSSLDATNIILTENGRILHFYACSQLPTIYGSLVYPLWLLDPWWLLSLHRIITILSDLAPRPWQQSEYIHIILIYYYLIIVFKLSFLIWRLLLIKC